MSWIYQVEDWIKLHWIIIVSGLLLLFILFLIIIWIKKIINNQKTGQKIQKIWKNKSFSKTNLIDVFISEINVKFSTIEFKKNNDNKKIAWFALVGILTRVIANKYDRDYGNPREALTSLYTFYKELREELKKYPLTFKSNIVILTFMNNELRPFLTKWNFNLNEKYQGLDQNYYINEYIKDFDSMYDSIIENEYIQNLLFILGWNATPKNFTISDGVENFKKEIIEEKMK